MAQLDVELHGVAPQIDVAILQAHLFVGEHGVRGQKGQLLRDVQNAQLFDHEFDFAGGNVGIDGVGVAFFHRADGGDDELVAQLFRFLMHGGIEFVVEDDLRHAGAVAKIDEDDLAEVAAAVDPSHEDGFFACVGEAQSPAHMSSFKIA